MKNLDQIKLEAKMKGGFITKDDMPSILAVSRLEPLLVRCGNARFTCPAQDLDNMIGYVEKGGDYVRDVSFPVRV